MDDLIPYLKKRLSSKDKDAESAYILYEKSGLDSDRLKADMLRARAHGYRLALNDAEHYRESIIDEMAEHYGEE
jgi:hypothetical protein